MRIIIALTTLVFSWCSVANAAIFNVLELNLETHAAVITIKGIIFAGDHINLENMFKPKSKIGKGVVVLDSPGGDMYSSMRMGAAIRKKGFHTRVADGAKCTSGCALIWLAGTARFIGPGGSVGFHSSSKDNKRSDIANAHILPYITKLGYSPELYSYIVRAEPSSMTWLTQQDADRYNLQTVLPLPISTARFLWPGDAKIRPPPPAAAFDATNAINRRLALPVVPTSGDAPGHH